MISIIGVSVFTHCIIALVLAVVSITTLAFVMKKYIPNADSMIFTGIASFLLVCSIFWPMAPFFLGLMLVIGSIMYLFHFIWEKISQK